MNVQPLDSAAFGGVKGRPDYSGLLAWLGIGRPPDLFLGVPPQAENITENRMKRVMGMAVLLTLGSFLCSQIARADDAGTGTWHPFGSFDYYGIGNSKQTAQEALNSICSGASGCGYSANVYGGYGARAGIFYKENSNFEWGGSLGYIDGGPDISGKGTISYASPAGSFSDTVTNNTLRLLAEAKESYPINQDWKFNIGAGLGWAMDMENDNYSSSGSLASIGSGTPTSNYGWATWEISPSFAYHHAQIGVRYVGFARGGFNPWNTIGAFLGYEF